MTKKQVLQVKYGQELHYTGKQDCQKIIGPRGKITINVVTFRVSGKVQTWKTRPDFRVPIKYGLYEHYEIHQNNCRDFHLPQDCPLNNPVFCVDGVSR